MGSATSSMSAEYEENKSKAHVLVIGGGWGGAHCCQQLRKHGIKFTLVDQRSFLYHNFASVRAVVQPDLTERLTFDYKTTFGDSFVKGKVLQVNLGAKTATLDSGRTVNFTKVVFATGAKGPFPGNTEQTEVAALLEEMSDAARDLEKAATVVIIGGGAVGTELAAEVRDVYKDKKIVIIHSRQGLASDSMGHKLQDTLKSICDNMDIEVKLGVRVTNLGEITPNKFMKQTVKIDSGEEFDADYVFTCVGIKIQTELSSQVFDLNELGHIKVLPDLRVAGHEDAYAIGDCCDFKQEKMAAHAADHGTLVADNINLVLGGKDAMEYKPRFTGMVVTMGANDGAGVYNGWALPSFVVSRLKGKNNMFLHKSQELMKPN